MNRLGAGRFHALFGGQLSQGRGQSAHDPIAEAAEPSDRRLAHQELGRIRARRTRRCSISSSRSAIRRRSEVCPIWPGQPMTAHWGVPDPAAATGTDAEIALAFSEAYRQLNNRIAIFVACR